MMDKDSNKAVKRIYVVLMALMLALQFLPALSTPVVAATGEASDWETFKDLVNSGVTEITITGDILMDESLTIRNKLTIKGDKTISYKDKEGSSSYNSMFIVADGGDLTLGGTIKLSGKKSKCEGGSAPTTTSQTALFKFNSGNPSGYYFAIVSGAEVGYMPKSNATTITIEQDGYINVGGKYLGVVDGHYEFSLTSKTNALRLTTAGASFNVTPVNGTDSYYLCDPNNGNQFLGYDEDYGQMAPVNSSGSALEIKFEDIQSVGGSAPTPCTMTSTCAAWTNQEFDGDLDNPKGFFVQVEQGGKATLAGATLEHFYTDNTKAKTPRHVAPVVANGGTFDIKSGSIQNNVVGYIAEDSKSNQNANAIKMYVKGGAPNAPRKGNLANKDNRRRSKAGIDAGDAGSGITGTAGAVIYTGGARGTISDGSISYNRGDTGGIMVSGEGSAVDITGANVKIDHNVGVQFGGGAFVEDGGFIGMTNGIMSENVAWFGGGAVFATENGIKWLLGEQTSYDARKGGMFTLNGGTLDNNTSFTRGGAILADSDGVALIKGKLTNNKSRMLGGAVYVMGDDPRYTYMVYIEKGYVHDNKAVSSTLDKNKPATALTEDKEENMALSKILNKANPCGNSEALFTNDMTTNSDDTVDWKDGNGRNGDATAGTGGGVWLCAYGNTNLNFDEDKFVVNHNYASGSKDNRFNDKENQKPDDGSSNKTGGNDLHKDTKGNGNVAFTGITADSKWYNENTGELFSDASKATEGVLKDYGKRNLVNTSTYVPDNLDDLVEVTGNISRRGGGLAADGTFVFGTATPIADIYAEMAIEKVWNSEIPKEDIAVRVYVEKDGKKYVVQDVLLSANEKEASELDTSFTDGNYKAHFVVPIMVEDEKTGKQIQVFEIKDSSNKNYNVANVNDLSELAQKIKAGEEVSLDTSNVKFVFEEGTLDDDGNFVKSDKYNFISDNVVVDTANADIHTHTQQLDSSGTTKDILSVSNTNIYLKNAVINDNKPEVEKYVNEAVHKDIDLDEVFKYDILAYVTMDADKVIITDELVSDLEFVSGEGDVKVYDLGTKNNHKVTNDINDTQVNDDATVANTDKEVELKEVSIVDNTLTVTLDDKVDSETGDRESEVVKDLRGHWIKVSFEAQIKQELQDEIKAGTKTVNDLENVKITENNPVESDESHDGISNKASYKVEVNNEGRYEEESNTVTVRPEKPEIEKYVNEAVHKDITLDEEFTYDIVAYITKDADKFTISDELVEQLQFVSTAEEVKVVDLGTTNNHKVTNDISSVQVNDDATVASEGTSIDEAEVTITDNLLTVTVDDKVNAETGDREREVVKGLRGHWVKVTFTAKIKDGLTVKDLNYKEIKDSEKEDRDAPSEGNDPVESDEDHKGVPNKAKYEIEVKNEAKYNDESNTVTVKPEAPEIEKYVNKNVHKDISLDEVFTYDILAYVTEDADEVGISDTLVADLEFVSSASDIKVVDLGRAVDHTPEGSVSKDGEEVEAEVSISGQTLTITLKEEAAHSARGHWVKATFDAKIKTGLTLDDLTYVSVEKDVVLAEDSDRAETKGGNLPVITDEDHEGVPNTSTYKIKVGNEYKYEDKSNTVTVKPKTEFTVMKTWNDLENPFRPKSVTMHLYKDGKDTGLTAVLSDENNWTYTFTGLDKAEYTVKEDAVRQYFNKMYRQGEAMEIVENISRPWIPETPDEDMKYGDFYLTKFLAKSLKETDKVFEFEVRMVDKDGKEIFSETAKLKHSETKAYEFIPVGTTVYVKELTKGYKATYMIDGKETQSCTITDGAVAQMVVTNNKDVPDTSDNSKNALWLALLSISAIILAGGAYVRFKATK